VIFRKDGTAAKLPTPTVEDMSEVPSITTNKPTAKGWTAEKLATEAAFKVYSQSRFVSRHHSHIHILIDKQSIIHFRWCRSQIGTHCHWHHLFNDISPARFHGPPNISTFFTPIAHISIDISGTAVTGIGEQLEQPSNSIANNHST
jgi:hypothetical protein